MEYAEGNSKNLRQKAIGLLYLLFIALVFIYVPADFLDSINEATKSLETTSAELKNLKEQKFSMFENESTTIGIDQVVDSANYRNISHISDSTITYIEAVKKRLVDTTGGLNKFGYPAKSKEFDITDHLMLNTDEASNLKNILVRYRNEIRTYVTNEQESVLDSILQVKRELTSSQGNPISWEKFYFKKAPLSVTLMMLSKFQAEIRLIEYIILDKYERDFLQDFFVKSGREVVGNPLPDSLQKFLINTTTDVVEPGEKIVSYIVSEEPLEDILPKLQAFAKSGDEMTSLTVDDRGFIEFTPTKPGNVTLTANVDGETTEVTVSVVPKRSEVTTKELEVLYAGIPNPLRINFANHNPNDLKISVNRGSIKKYDSLYYVQASTPGKLRVTVETQVNGRRTLLRNEMFQVKELPAPYASLGVKQGGTIPSQSMRIQNKLNVKSDLLEAGNHYSVKGFKLLRIPSSGIVSRNEIANQGSGFSPAVKSELRLAQSGDIYVFSDIKAFGRDNREKDVAAMVFKVE